MSSSTDATPAPQPDSREGTPPEPAARKGRGRGSATAYERFLGLIILVIVFVLWWVTLPGEFLTTSNLLGVVNNQTITAIVALGVLIPLAAGVFDISIAGIITISVVIVTQLFQVTNGHMPVVLAIAITLAAALLGGLLNGFLVVKIGMDPFITTLGTGSVFIGLATLISGGVVVSQNIPSSFTKLGQSSWGQVPISVFYVIVIAAVIWYLLAYTPFGRMLYATGQGRPTAKLAGVPTNRLIYVAYLFSALLASVGGIVFAAQLGSGQPNVGDSYLLPVYAAAFLGSTMIVPGRFNVPGLIVAILLLAVGINGLLLHGATTWVTSTFQGAVLIVAVALTKLRGGRFRQLFMRRQD
jgi:ribose transport system permease protein